MSKTPVPPAIYFLIATIGINAIGFGIIVPVVPSLIMELTDKPIHYATALGGWLSFTYAAFQFVFSPIMGNLSDRFGRRPVIIASMAGFSVDFLALALAPSIVWLFLARAFAGIFGASNAPAQSAIADLVPPDERSRYFGMLGAAFGVGFVLGPMIGGLLGHFGPRVPFFAAAVLAASNALFGLFVLPETLKPENRRKFDWKRANPVGALLHVRKLPGIVPISAVYFLWQVASLVYPMIWPYFAKGRYGWSDAMVGASLAGIGVVIATAQIMALPRLVPRYGERKTALVGIIGSSLTMFAYAAATQSWMAFLLLVPMGTQALVHSNLTSMMTRRADATTLGEVQGFASSIMALGALVAPILFNPLESYFSSPNAPFIFHGAAFVVAGFFAASCIPIMIAMKPAPVSDKK